MSTPNNPADGITDRGAFNDALSRLIEKAASNEIDICGGYRYNADDDGQDFGVEIYRVIS